MTFHPRNVFENAEKVAEKRQTGFHKVHKMAAGILHPDAPDVFVVSVNRLPAVFGRAFSDPEQEFGGCSQRSHAEIDNTYEFGGRLNGNWRWLKPHCCPNCGKDIIASGTERLYIDTRSKDTHYMRVQAKHSSGADGLFEKLTLPLLIANGISIYEVDVEKEIITPVYEHPKTDHRPLPEFTLYPAEAGLRKLQIFGAQLMDKFNKTADWSAALVEDKHGKMHYLVTTEVLPPGQTPSVIAHRLHGLNVGKYSSSIDSLSVLMMTARREEMTILDNALVSNVPPYPRALFNATAAGISHITLNGWYAEDRLAQRQEALMALADGKVLKLGMPLDSSMRNSI